MTNGTQGDLWAAHCLLGSVKLGVTDENSRGNNVNHMENHDCSVLRGRHTLFLKQSHRGESAIYLQQDGKTRSSQ